jgi:predicted lipoprotein
MLRLVFVACCLSLALAGCKIVPNPKEGASTAQQTEAEQMAAKVDAIWKPRVLPDIEKHAQDFNTVSAAIQRDAEAAGKTYGIRSDSVVANWNYVVRGKGVIVGADLESLGAVLKVDTTGDGQANLSIQLGPIVNGTALRDVLTFLPFADFRDQIEYAKFASALNKHALAGITRPKGDPVGDTVSFTGVFSDDGAGQGFALVPVTLEVEPKT